MKKIQRSLLLLCALLAASPVRATLGASFQMQLGNPSSATTDPANHTRYLVQRAQYAMDYDDTTHEPNWVSWNLTAADVGGSGRSDFAVDPDLPLSFRRVLTTDYVGSGYDRGHMCPSADRTVTTADNQATFYMSNMVPQAPDNNQGVWASFETYCRTLASAGNEILLVAGPSAFSGMPIASGVAVPGFTWKVAVVVPLGPGTAVSRITTTTRVIAIKIPNIQGIRSNPWQNYVTSAAQLETDTGFTFFTELSAAVASALRTKVDGQNSTGAPTITTQPASQTAVAGSTVTFSVSATGTAPLSYQWSKDDTEIAGATNATLQLAPVQTGDAGSYTVVVTNTAGSIASNAATLVVAAPVAGDVVYWSFDTATPGNFPAGVTSSALTQNNNNGTTPLLTSVSISSGYAGASGGNNAGAAARVGPLNTAASGSAYFEFTLTPAAGQPLTVTGLSFGSRSTSTGPQAYDIFSSVDNFTTRVATGALVNNSTWTLQAPVMTTVTGAAGSAVTFRIYGYGGSGSAATSTANWRIDDLKITASTSAPVPARFVNLSTRARAGVGVESAIAGFVISGTEAKTLLIRAVGPTLGSFGVTGTLAAPKLDLMQGTTTLATNTGWTTATNSAAIAAAATSTGAFPLGARSADSALLVTLAAGNYTALASAANAQPGVALVEIYDVSGSSAAQKLVNLSTRAFAGTGNTTLIAGFVIDGASAKRVLIRAAGPALAAFGVSGVLARPQLVLRAANGDVVAQNTGWSTSADAAAIATAAAQAGAFAFATGSADSALLVTLPAGNYTAQVIGADGGTGIALVEVYDVP
jgi:DNA/RNA endonuclease G (NUC1)